MTSSPKRGNPDPEPENSEESLSGEIENGEDRPAEGWQEDDDVSASVEPTSTVLHFSHSRDPQRLDVFLCDRLPGRSRAFIQRLIDTGYVSLEPPGRRDVKPSLKICAGTNVRVVIPPPTRLTLTPEPIPLEFLYQDEHFAVVNKPAGLAAHPNPTQVSHTLVNALLYWLEDLSGVAGVERPGIVHRLDKETSGVLAVARNDFAHNAIANQFKERTVRKTYLAVVRGRPREWEGRVDLPLGRSYTNSKKTMTRSDGTGRTAVTDYRVLETFDGYALMELYPLTGRTHQIRVHMCAIQLPVACDKLYGREKRIFLSEIKGKARQPQEVPFMSRQALHAASLTLRHPVTREEMTFSAPLHDDMLALIRALQTYRSPR